MGFRVSTLITILLSISLMFGCVQSPSKGVDIYPFYSERHVQDIAESHLSSTFKDIDFVLKEVEYYHYWDQFIVLVEDENQVEFSVEVFRNGMVICDYVRTKISISAIAEIEPIMEEILKTDVDLNIISYLTNAQIKNSNLTFEKADSFKYLVYVQWEDKNMNKEQFATTAALIRDVMEEEGFYGANLFLSCVGDKETFTVMLNRDDGTYRYGKSKILSLI